MSQATREFAILSWAYSPTDYFEAPIRLVRDAYAIWIADGKVEVRVEASLYDQDPQLRDALRDAVNDWFLGARLASHRAYELSGPVVTRVYFDAIATGRAEAQRARRPAEPNVAAEERVEPDRAAGAGEPTMDELAETYSSSDLLLDSLLRRYDQAVTDPARELARLREVPEALATIFGSAGAARAALDIREADWSRLIEMGDRERQAGPGAGQEGPISQAPASDAERAEARAITLRMILAYLRYTKPKPDASPA